ncbi:MAG: TolC family protein [Planctomycetia bacterium]|nr:TolC family protein [Planctomycetia bacterium]
MARSIYAAPASVAPIDWNEFSMTEEESTDELVSAPSPRANAPSVRPSGIAVRNVPAQRSSAQHRVSRAPSTIPKAAANTRVASSSAYATPPRSHTSPYANAIQTSAQSSVSVTNDSTSSIATPQSSASPATIVATTTLASVQTPANATASVQIPRVAAPVVAVPATPVRTEEQVTRVNLTRANTEFVASRLSVAPTSARVAQQASSAESLTPQNSTSSAQTYLETLEDATSIALAQSRTQRALALKRGASQSMTQAATSLRNPKINNSTAYVGMLNKPTEVSEVDLSNALSGVVGSLPPSMASLISPALASFPTQYQIDTPLCDRNFVTTTTSVTIPIYLGGRVNALTREAEALTQAVSAGIEVGEQHVKYETSEVYFMVLRTRQLRQVAIEAVQTAQSHLQDAERMENVGMLTRNAVLAAQVAVSEAQQMELRLANAQELAEATYNRVLWRPLDTPVAIAEVDTVMPLGELEELTQTALRTRSELQALSAQTRALQAHVDTVKADVRPQVAAIGAYSYFENSHLKDNSNATAAIGVTWTPFDGGVSRARQNAARQEALATTRLREEAESGVRLQVRQAWLAEKEARERVQVAQTALEQAQENYRVTSRAFQEGLLNHTEALDAATMLTAAKSNLANAKYDAILATQRLKHAVGVL